MNPLRNTFFLTSAISVFFLCGGVFSVRGQSGDSFEDLTSERKPVYGSEKEEKYPIRAIVFKMESWEQHFSWDALFVFGYTHYPKFKEYNAYPFFYHLKDKNSDSYRSWSFPLYFSQRIDRGSSRESFHFSLFHSYSYEETTNHKKESIRFPSFLPLAGKTSEDFANGSKSTFSYFLPFLFFKKNEEASDWTHFLLFHSGEDRDSKYGAVLPLLYWSKGKSKSHLTLFPLFSYRSDQDGQEGNFISPFFFRSWSENASLNSSETSAGLPWLLSFRSEKRQSGEVLESNLFSPIFFRNYSRSIGTSSNLLYLIGWKSGPENELKSAYFFPFLFYKKDSYFTAFPFYFSGSSSDRSYWNVLGLAGAGDDGNERYSYVFPFYYRSESPSERFGLYGPLEIGQTGSSSQWNLHPFFYSGRSDSGSFWNVLGLIGRGKTGTGEQRYAYAFPLYYHKNGDFRIFFPFFFRFGYEENEYSSFGIFHYMKRSADLDRTWALLYYSKEDRKEKETSQILFPLYYSWDTQASKASIFLPFYLKYEEEDKSLDLNLAGFSSSKSLGTLHGLTSASVGINEKEIYLDTDFSWFYNLVRVSYRESISKDSILWWKRKVPEAKEIPSSSASQPGEDGLRKYKTLSRETSRSFFGFSTLFGILSYERGDERRHFRLLPLAWYSWSEATKDQVTVWLLPPIFKSRIGDQEYNVIFPFYARQDDGPDYQEAWMILGFQRGKKGETKDYSVLWPLFRTYFSPDSWGFRALPFVLHDSSPERKRTISILYYNNIKISQEGESFGFHSFLPPLYHSRGNTRTLASGNRESDGWQLLLPFFFRIYDSIEGPVGGNSLAEVYTLLSYYRKSSDIAGGFDTTFLFPLYYYHRVKAPGESAEQIEKTDLVVPIGLYSWRKGESSRSFFLGYYSEKDPGASYGNLLGIFAFSKVSAPDAEFSESRVFPFFFSESADAQTFSRSKLLVPLFYSSVSSELKDGTYSISEILTPLYYRYRKTGIVEQERERSDLILPLCLYFHQDFYSSSRFILGYYAKESRGFSHWSLFGLIASEKTETDTWKKRSFRIAPFLFTEQKSDLENGQVYSSVLVPLLFYSDFSPHSYTWNVLLLGNRTKSETEDSFAIYPFYSSSETDLYGTKSRTIWGIPFYYERTEKESGLWDSFSIHPFGVFSSEGKGKDREDENWTNFYFLPLPTLYTSGSRSERVLFWLGFYYHRTEPTPQSESQEISFLKFLAYNRSRSQSGSSSDFRLFPLISFGGSEGTEDKGRTESTTNYVFPLFFYHREVRPSGGVFHLNLGILFDVAKDSTVGSNRLILGPWYSSFRPDSSSWGLLPLFLRHRSSDSNFWFGLGAYSYEDKEIDRWGFAGILDVNRELALRKRNVNVFLGLFHGEYEEARTRWAILGRLVAGYESDRDSFDTNFLWLRWKRSPSEGIANFLPLYYYHRDGGEVSNFVPPVLGYFSSGKDGRYDMAGLGLLYYRNESVSAGEDTMVVASGLFYYRVRPERGYRSMGILALPWLGGLLWDWEYETQTDYSKYSILQILYSNTTNAGKNYSRIFGIRF